MIGIVARALVDHRTIAGAVRAVRREIASAGQLAQTVPRSGVRWVVMVVRMVVEVRRMRVVIVEALTTIEELLGKDQRTPFAGQGRGMG